MKIEEIAKKLAVKNRLPKAEAYDLVYRDYDDSVELIGYVADPTYDMKDFVGREMLFPKRWVTLAVLPSDTQIQIEESK